VNSVRRSSWSFRFDEREGVRVAPLIVIDRVEGSRDVARNFDLDLNAGFELTRTPVCL
jgi:hypothetical protein